MDLAILPLSSLQLVPVTRIEIFFLSSDRGVADTNKRSLRINELWRTVQLFLRNSVILRK